MRKTTILLLAGIGVLISALISVTGCESRGSPLDPPRTGITRIEPAGDLVADDSPGDAGRAITLSWAASPTENTPEFRIRAEIERRLAASGDGPEAEARIRAEVNARYAKEPRILYRVYRVEESKGKAATWKRIAEFPSGRNFERLSDIPCDFRERGGDRHYFKVRNLEDGRTYHFRVELTLGKQVLPVAAREKSAAPLPALLATPGVVAATSRPNWFNPDKRNLLIGVLVLVAITLFFLHRAKQNPRMFIRKIDGLNAVDQAIRDAAKSGRPVYYLMGIGQMSDLPTIASLSILERIAGQAARHGLRVKVPCYDPVVMSVAEDVVRGAFEAEGKGDDFVKDDVFFVTQDQFSYAASVDGMLMRDRPSTTFLLGHFQAESLLLSEVGANIGSVQIAGTDTPAQLPFFVTTTDYTLIGEELYAAGAYLSRDTLLLGSLRAQDAGKALLMAVIVIGVVLASFEIDWLRGFFE